MRSSPSSAQSQRGLSLVELMVAVTLGLLITAAIITLFVNTSRTNREMAKTNAQIESGRFAIQLIQNNVVHAGFWGGYIPDFDDLTASTTPVNFPTAVPAPCAAYASWDAAYKTNLIGIPLQVYDGVPSGCESIITNKRANTDVLLVRYAATCIPGADNCEAETSGKLYFQPSRCESDANQFVLDTSGFTLRKRKCTTSGAGSQDGYAEKRKYISYIYYVRNCSLLNADGTCADSIPTLVRSEFDLSAGTLAHKTPEALINGIEGFRVEVGIDTISDDGTNIVTGVKGANPANTALRYDAVIKWADDENLTSPVNRGDGLPDSYVRCAATGCTFTELMNAVTLKVYVLARAEDSTNGYSDTKTYSLGTASKMCSTTSTDSGCPLKVLPSDIKRHVFMTTIRLNNISGRRETP
jgi:type IV pilus assembly protein PilW